MQFRTQDLGLTILWALMWFIASVAWAAESNQLQDDLEDITSCRSFSDSEGTLDEDNQTFVQANISIVSFSCLYVISRHTF